MANNVPEWLHRAIFYEIYPQSFYDTNADGIGDIQGIIEKLDYVKYLGFNAIWVNPCFVSPFCDAGYDVADYYQIAPRYGSNEDAKRLFEEAHRRDIRVCFDLVPGHTSTQNQWFVESCKPAPNRYSNWYIWTDSIWSQPAGRPFVAGYADRDACYITNFFYMQPALNYGFAEPDKHCPWQLPTDYPDVIAVREEIKDVMRFWLNMGVDGFRVDMAASLVKNDPGCKKTGEFWMDVRQMLDREFPEAALISEWSSPADAIGSGFHCDFLLHVIPEYYALFRREVKHLPIPETASMHSYFKREGLGDIVQFLDIYQEHYQRTRHAGYISFITGNHDLSRLAMDRDCEEIKVAFAFILTMPGVPFVYNGDEIGIDYMEGLVSKEGGYGRTGSRTPMQWTKGPNAGFSSAAKDRLYLPVNEQGPSVDQQIGVEGSLLETVRMLNHLRLNHPALGPDGEFRAIYAEKDRYPFVYIRELAGERVLVAVNPSGRSIELELDAVAKDTANSPLLASGAALHSTALSMQPVSYGIFALE